MTVKPGVKGTYAETQVTRFLATHLDPGAERRRLSGCLDRGDIGGTHPDLCWEVKYSGGARLALGTWFNELATEKRNAGARFGVLVIKPKGVGDTRVGEWYAGMLRGDLVRLADVDPDEVAVRPAVQVVHTMPGSKLDQLPLAIEFQVSAALQLPSLSGFPFVQVRAKGHAHIQGNWYMFTQLRVMTALLQNAGYDRRG